MFGHRNFCLFRNYRFWLHQFPFNNEAEYQQIKWQCFVDSNKAELLQKNEHSSSQPPENSLNEIEMFPDDLIFSWIVPVKWFRTWTNRFSCFSSMKGPVIPLILRQRFKGMHKILKELKLSRDTRNNWGKLLSLSIKQCEKFSLH